MTNEAVQARLEEIDRRAVKASPAPWQECGHVRGGCDCRQVWSLPADVEVACATTAAERQGEGATVEHAKENAVFIAHAREDVPWLCQQVRTLLARVATHERYEGFTRTQLDATKRERDTLLARVAELELERDDYRRGMESRSDERDAARQQLATAQERIEKLERELSARVAFNRSCALSGETWTQEAEDQAAALAAPQREGKCQ